MKKIAVLAAALSIGACTTGFYPPGDDRVVGQVPSICTFFGYHKFDETMDPSCKTPVGAKRDGGLWVRDSWGTAPAG